MNKLKGSTAYLIGNMDGVPDNSYIVWREDISNFLKSLNVFVLNPVEKPLLEVVEDEDFRNKRSLALSQGDYDTVTSMMKPVRRVDLRCVDKSDFLICNLDMKLRPFGTIEELVTANREKKPVILYTPQGKRNLPEWLFSMMPHELFFEDWNQLKQYIINVDSGSDQEHYRRWWFFDHEMLKTGTKL